MAAISAQLDIMYVMRRCNDISYLYTADQGPAPLPNNNGNLVPGIAAGRTTDESTDEDQASSFKDRRSRSTLHALKDRPRRGGRGARGSHRGPLSQIGPRIHESAPRKNNKAIAFYSM